MKEIRDIFSCLPQCQTSQLNIYEWIIILVSITLVFYITRAITKLAFTSHKNEQDSVKWHIPRFVFITSIVSFVTTAPIVLLFGFDVAKTYIKALPFISIIIYLIWLSHSGKQNT